MIVATINTVSQFRSDFSLGAVPFFGILYEDSTETRIEVQRSEDGTEIIDFRSQGERLAIFIKRTEEQGLVRLFEPSESVDLFTFWEKVHEFYLEVPEIPEYFKNVLDPGPEEVHQELEKQCDKIVFGIIMGLEAFPYEAFPEDH